MRSSGALCFSVQGVDFFFAKRSHGQRFLDFLQGVVPMRYRTDKQLVSHNEQNATYNYKYTFSVEIVPICKVLIMCVQSYDAAVHTFHSCKLRWSLLLDCMSASPVMPE